MYEQIERVHLFACKRFLHVRNKTPNDVVYRELGRCPLFIPATVRFVKYWLKLLRQTDNLYSKKSYKMLLEMQNRCKTTWVSHIRSVLCYNGFEQVWLFGCRNDKIFFNELKERLYSSFCNGWWNHLESSERLAVYKGYKNCFEREKYVDFLWVDVYRNAFAQFRVGVSQINIHQHSFSPTARNVACPFCVEEREREINFLLECPVYVFLRHKYLPDKANARDNRSHFLSLMNSKSQQTIFNVAKFLV